MISVKNHAKQRYCERLLFITESVEWKRYLAQNDQLVVEQVNKMVFNSTFIYRGQLGDNTTKVFRIVDNVVLVLDSQQSCVITMFVCSFDFGEDMDRQIIANELSKITVLNEELKQVDEQITTFIENKTTEATTYDQQIKAMEEQIKLLKVRKNSVEEEIKGKRASRDFTYREIEKRAVRICNSNDYRKDLNANAS